MKSWEAANEMISSYESLAAEVHSLKSDVKELHQQLLSSQHVFPRKKKNSCRGQHQ